MSKSYGKYKTVGICYGSNTEFYRGRRKHQRHVNNHRIRNVIANSNIEDFDDNYEAYTIPKNDDYKEPTDGHNKLNAKDLKRIAKRARKIYGVYTSKNNKVKK